MKNIPNTDMLFRSGEAIMPSHAGGLRSVTDFEHVNKAHGSENPRLGRGAERDADFEALYGVFHKPLLHFFKLKLPADEDPEDNVQAVFKRLVEIKDKPGTSLSRWFIFKIANNMVVDRYRWRSRHKVNEMAALDEQALVEKSPLQDQVFEGKERLAQFQARLEELPERPKQVFILHRVYGYSHKEVAEKLGISVSTVEKHMIKAALKVNTIMKDMT